MFSQNNHHLFNEKNENLYMSTLEAIEEIKNNDIFSPNAKILLERENKKCMIGRPICTYSYDGSQLFRLFYLLGNNVEEAFLKLNQQGKLTVVHDLIDQTLSSINDELITEINQQITMMRNQKSHSKINH